MYTQPRKKDKHLEYVFYAHPMLLLLLISIQAVGFDMDYTLAQYKPDTFEQRAHQQTIDKLVTAFGYPTELYDFKFDWRYMMRGLIMDKVFVVGGYGCW